jgi:hypothetical protein
MMSLSARSHAITSLTIRLAGIVALVTILVLQLGTTAQASSRQVALFEDPSLRSDPGGAMSQLRLLGVGAVRMSMAWSSVAPDSASPTRPFGFNASDPAAYPGTSWAPYDAIVNAARSNRIGVLLLVTDGAPLWATAPDRPSSSTLQWKPSASEYEQFVRAVATRYSGRYRPCGPCAVLPRVSSWEIWNEPNWGPSLAPQAINGSTTSTSPIIYRGLLDAGWRALASTGHGHDTIVVGSLSPRGFRAKPGPGLPQGLPGYFSTTKPLQFLRSLYCVDSRYRQLRGGAAAAAGCPTSGNSFRGQHPALFGANGFGIHPYPINLPPTRADSRDPDYVEFNELPRLASTLDRLQRVYGSHRRLAMYNTEYGYVTNPPNRSHHFVSPATAAAYINEAEYISWHNPRIATTMQYQLNDPNPHVGEAVYGFGSFASGLIFYHGGPKADYYAYRMPIFLPLTSARRGRALEVWGCVRPAHVASGRQRVRIEFTSGSQRAFRTVRTVAINSARGYFDTRVAFRHSGAVRLSWRSPSGQTIHSRTVKIRVR